MTEEDSSLTINATCESLDSGFMKISVTDATGSNAPSAGDFTYGFELSGYMLPFVSFTDNKLLPTVIAGSCPSGDIKHNFIVSYAKGNNDSSNFDEWGTFGFWQSNNANNTLKVNIFKRNSDSPDEEVDVDSWDMSSICSSGKFSTSGGEDADTTAYFSQSGGLIWNQASTTDERIENDFMIPYDDGVTDVGGVPQVDGNYIGYTISGNGQTSYTNTPVSVTVNNGEFIAKRINPDDGIISATTHSKFSLGYKVTGTEGLFRGTITDYNEQTATTSDGLGCAIDLDAGGTGKDVIICGGMLPDGSLKNLYSAILVSQ